MSNTVTEERQERQESEFGIIEMMLAADQIYIPKELMLMRLHARSTLLISEIITDNRFKTVSDVKEIVKDYLHDDEFLLSYAFDDKKVANQMKRDIQKVLNNFDEIFSKKNKGADKIGSTIHNC